MNTPNSDKPAGGKPVIVKKYANRRLYNTATSSYVTLDDLARLIKEGGDFVAHDAKTGEDITRSVLTQIIVEQEQKGQNLLPISFLRQLISFYGDSMQFLVPGYLEQAMVAFARNQEQMRKSLQASFGNFPFSQFEEMGKQNMALFERALKMLSPYGRDEPSPEQLYSTRAAIDGGTPSPWRPEQPGRILDLRCGACWALFRWDYFGSRLLEMVKEGDPESVPGGLRPDD
jgi:polyhydroxyalkanoate synthesis repressor PhaR